MSRAGRIIKRIIFIVVNILTNLYIAALSLFSPYAYVFSEDVKIVNSDRLVTLFIFWWGIFAHLIILILLESIVFKQKKIPVWIYYGCVAAYVCFKMIQILWIDFKW